MTGGAARWEVLIPAVTGVSVAVPGVLIAGPAMGLLLGFDAMATVSVVWLLSVILRRDADQTAKRATTTDPDRAASDLALLIAALASLIAVGFVLARAGRQSGIEEALWVGLGLVSVLLSWTLVHTLFTLRYAASFYGPHPGGIDFNSAEPPDYRDFAYVAFTIGMTFQISDTTLRTPALRRLALRHALLSYVFGTGILATTINLVATLSSR